MTGARFQHIGITANLDKDRARALVGSLAPALVEAGFDVSIDPDLQPSVGEVEGVRYGALEGCDLVVAAGGDGTILTNARRYHHADVPVLGVKGGRLGFLTEGRSDEVAARLRDGRFHVQERVRIDARFGNGEGRSELGALNDVVVHAAGYSRMVALSVSVDDKLLWELRADGVIVATPTGSTAYSLSAGGPLLEPTLRAIVITPLAPHSMRVRPIVVEEDQTIVIRVMGGARDIVVTVDGQEGGSLAPGQLLEIRRSARPTKLVVPDDYDFYALLREKL